MSEEEIPSEAEILAKYSTPGLKRNNVDQKKQVRVDENGKPIFDKEWLLLKTSKY